MNALILAAGFSTRLYPLTKHFPKALLPVGDKALMDYMLEDLLSVRSVTGIALVTNAHYRPLFETWISARYPKGRITVSANGIHDAANRNGALGDILYGLEKMKWESDDCMVLASDTLASLSFSSFVAYYKAKKNVVNAVYDTKNKSVIKNRLGCVEMEGDHIAAFEEKPEHPKSTVTSIPYYIYTKAAIALLRTYKRQNGNMDAPGSIMQWFLGKVPVYGYRVEGYYYDVGTLETYNTIAEADFL